MNPYEVMWSFVIGFYGELKFGKFKLSDDKITGKSETKDIGFYLAFKIRG